MFLLLASPVKEPSPMKSINASLAAMSKTMTQMGKDMRQERKLEAQENERRGRMRDLKIAAEILDLRHASPRSRRIVFTGFRTGDFEIYTIRPDGTDLLQLTSDRGNDAHAVWSPDGVSLLFTSSRVGWKDEAMLPGRGGQSYGEIVVMRADGTHVRQLTDDQWEESADAWLLPARRQ